jgi:hypothetical protein
VRKCVAWLSQRSKRNDDERNWSYLYQDEDALPLHSLLNVRYIVLVVLGRPMSLYTALQPMQGCECPLNAYIVMVASAAHSMEPHATCLGGITCILNAPSKRKSLLCVYQT